MKQFTLQTSLLVSVLGLALSALAAPPPPANTTPPDFDKTQVVGEKIKKAEPNLKDWHERLTGEMGNFNAYTEKLDESAFVLKFLKTCRTSAFSGLPTQCDFSNQEQGRELFVNALVTPTYYKDDKQRENALAFIRNLSNMTPLPYPGDKVIFKNPDKKSDGLTEEGISYFAKMFKQIPLLSVAQASLLALFTDRERLPGMAGGLPVGQDGSASLLEVLGYEASRRYMNPSWFQQMDKASDSATFHEIAYMMAFQNYMMVKSYEQNSRIEALLAAQLSGMNKFSGMMDQAPDAESIQKQVETVQ